MKIEAAIFDMDGTLLDSMGGWATAGERYLRCHGLTPHRGDEDSLLYQGMQGIAQHFQSVYGVADPAQCIIEEINELVRDYYDTQATVSDGVIEFLSVLKARGVPMCVATATDRCLVEPTLERLGLRPYFEKIFTCSEVGQDKTKPVIYDMARAFMGTPRETTWVFEDALYAARTAKAAGYPLCGVYDRYERQTARLQMLADGYIRSYREVDTLPFWNALTREKG